MTTKPTTKYYMDKTALEKYAEFVRTAYPDYDCQVVHLCPNCNKEAAWVDCNRYNALNNGIRTHDSWVHAVIFPGDDQSPRALKWCIEDGRGGFNTQDLIRDYMELGVYKSHTAPTVEKPKCTCDMDVVMAKGCQCGGV